MIYNISICVKFLSRYDFRMISIDVMDQKKRKKKVTNASTDSSHSLKGQRGFYSLIQIAAIKSHRYCSSSSDNNIHDLDLTTFHPSSGEGKIFQLVFLRDQRPACPTLVSRVSLGAMDSSKRKLVPSVLPGFRASVRRNDRDLSFFLL